MSIQADFLKELENNDDKIAVLKKYTEMITDDDINEDLKIDIKTCNIYVEYATKKLINEYKTYSDRMNAYIVLYHPKLFELICANKTMAEVINIKNILLHNVDSIYEGHIKDDKYEVCSDMLSCDIKKDRHNAFEYCYYLSWASFDKNWVDVKKDYVLANNKNDILCVNATYNLKNLDSIVMYNNVANIKIPILTDEMVDKTVKYRYITPTRIADKPVNIYDKDFKPIKDFSTEKVSILIDYGNDYYTKCFFHNNNEIPARFARDVFNGKVKYNDNKTLLFNIVYKDVYKHLPKNCYSDKNNKSELMDNYNVMKRVAIRSYNPNRKTCLHSILNDKELTKILNHNEIPAFELYLKYLLSADEYNDNIVINHCCNYLFENLLESKTLIDIS